MKNHVMSSACLAMLGSLLSGPMACSVGEDPADGGGRIEFTNAWPKTSEFTEACAKTSEPIEANPGSIDLHGPPGKRIRDIHHHIPILSQVVADYYVDALNGSDANGRGAMDSPWRTVSHALERIPEVTAEVHVAPGRYDMALGETFPLSLREGVSLLGARPESTILDATGSGQGVMIGESITSATTLEGFTLTGGAADGPGAGGGLQLADSQLNILNNMFLENSAINAQSMEVAGGGISLIESSPTIDRNSFVGNVATNSAASTGAGGGIAINSSSPTLTTNLFYDNIAFNEYTGLDATEGSAAGGGIFITWSSEPLLENNLIINNEAYSGEDYGSAGGGLAVCYTSSPRVAGNIFRDNLAEVDGLGGNAAGGLLVGFASAPDVQTNLVTGNTATGDTSVTATDFMEQVEESGDVAGGISVVRSSNPVVNRNLVTENSATNSATSGTAGGGISISYGSSPRISHNSVQDNQSYAYFYAGGINSSRLSGATISGNYIADNLSIEGQDRNGGGGIGFGPHDQEEEADRTLAYNNIIARNTGNGLDYSGGISIRYGAHPTLENLLIVQNTGWAGGISGYLNAGFTVVGSTVSDNEGWLGMYTLPTYYSWMNPRVESSIFRRSDGGSGIYYAAGWYNYLTVNYSDIQGGNALPGAGNVDLDPLFANPSIDDYHLSSESPVIDLGGTSLELTFDVDGDSRPADQGYDMGADEYSEAAAVFILWPQWAYNDAQVEVSAFGVNFEGIQSVHLGEIELTGFEVENNTHLSATIPAGLASRTYDLTVVTDLGSSALNEGDQFTLLDGGLDDIFEQPYVVNVDPSTGYAGDSITVGGANLSSATSVFLGSSELVEWTLNDDTQIQASIPSELAAGTYQLVVSSEEDSSAISTLSKFTVLKHSGHTYYADVNADSGEEGDGSSGSPWTPLTEALASRPSTGSTIYLAAGEYNVSSGESFPLSLREGVSIVGEGVASTIIDATGSGSGVMRATDIAVGSDTQLKGITLTGGNSSEPESAGGLWLDNASPALEQVVVRDNYGTLAGGIVASNHSSPPLSNVLMVRNQADAGGSGGVYCTGQSDPTLNHVTISDNETGGVNADFGSFPEITNSIIWNNGGDMLWKYDHVVYSDLDADVETGAVNSNEGNISTDAQFVNAPEGDYHLRADSPAVDAAYWAYGVPFDVEGDKRYFYAGGQNVYDMGADEYSGISSITANDASSAGDGIQAGDTVTLLFSGPMEASEIDLEQALIGGQDIDQVLQLSNGHSWKDGAGGIGGGSWSTSEYQNDTLTIVLSVDGGSPTLTPGDSIYVDEASLSDYYENPVENSDTEVALADSFGRFAQRALWVLTSTSRLEVRLLPTHRGC